MRRILAPLFGVPGDTSALKAALKLAGTFSGRVSALHVSADPYDSFPVVGDAMTPQLLEAAMDSARELSNVRLKAARETFDTLTESDGEGIPADWRDETGRAHRLMPQFARLCDLAVIGGLGPKADPSIHIVFEAILFSSGRPVLLIPDGYEGTIGTRIALAWSDTIEASRALHNARPLMRAAERVDVLNIVNDAVDADEAAEVCTYLEAHDIKAAPRPIASDGKRVAAMLMDHARAEGADMLVLGAYGHSRLGEMVFGGVTHDILNDFDFPVLMTH